VNATGLPLFTDLDFVVDMPHTISYAITYRTRIDSFGELPKDKRPPRNLWDKPFRLREFLENIWEDDETKKNNKSDWVELDLNEVE
jgi:hypothetical protein